MKAVSSYLFSVTAAAVICAMIRGLFDKNTASGALIHLGAGILVVVTLISPLVSVQTGALPDLAFENPMQGAEAVSRGQRAAQEQMESVINRQLEAYIMKEASKYGASVTVSFSDPDPVTGLPGSAALSGQIPPHVRQLLQQLLQQLGIAKENQRWNGNP